MREISGGRRELPPALVNLFRRHRSRIPPIPGLWRLEILSLISGEQTLTEAGVEDAHDDEEDPDDMFRKSKRLFDFEMVRTISPSVIALSVPPILMMTAGAQRIGSEESCEQPIGTVLFLDGLVALSMVLAGGVSQASPRRSCALGGMWLFPFMVVGLFLRLLLAGLLLEFIAAVDYVGIRTDHEDGAERGKKRCSVGTYAWGVFFLVINLSCIIVAAIMVCVWWWRRITSPMLSLVIPGGGYKQGKLLDNSQENARLEKVTDIGTANGPTSRTAMATGVDRQQQEKRH